MELVTLLLTGGLAGWIAGTLVRGAGSGLVINILIGVVGGVLGGKILTLLGVAPAGWLVDLATAVAGAALLLAAFDLLRRRFGRPSS